MRKLHFLYQMQLRFDRAVCDHHFVMRTKPMEQGNQKNLEFSCRITPADTIDEIWDGFGNHGFTGAVRAPHEMLEVEAEGIVAVESCVTDEALHPMYRFPSAYTVPGEAVRGFLESAEGTLGHPLSGFSDVQQMMTFLHARLLYQPGATNVKTTAEEALAGGRGVCQDYAHIFISLCRLAGIPARYAAGMMIGEGQTHAWAEVWLDGHWQGFDPTNGRMVDDTYIKLTHGRDFADGAVDKGCFIGFASQTQQILVKVDEVT